MKLLNSLEEVFSRDRRRAREAARALYARIVGAARQEYFYRDRGVPDTLDGRFELIALHTVLVCRRLAAEGEAGVELGQDVFDAMIEDLDVNLRELGVNDPSLGKRMKEMARAFYGRRDAYASALDGGRRDALEDAVRRNLYGTADAGDDDVSWAAGYIHRTALSLQKQSVAELRNGEVRFAGPAP